MTNSSKIRITRFVDSFIRSQYVANWTAEKDGDFWNEPERAARCHDAAEFGADGKTHAEVIEDWRESFRAFVHDRRKGSTLDRFEDAVTAHFDSVENWHEKNGSLFKQIG